MKRLTLLALLLSLAGCFSSQEAYDRWVPENADRYAREFIALVARGEVDSAELKLPAEVPHDSARFYLRVLADSLSGAPLDSTNVIGWRAHSATGGGAEVTTREISFLIPKRGQWMVVTVMMKDSSSVRQLTGFRYRVVDHDPIALSAFTLRGKGVGHYLTLLFAGLAALASFGTATWVARQRGFPRRWLWTIVALLGVGTVTVDWTTGHVTFEALQVLMFSAGGFKSGPASPWLISFAFPAGAFVAVARFRAWKAKEAVLVAETPPAGAPPGPDGPEPQLTPRS